MTAPRLPAPGSPAHEAPSYLELYACGEAVASALDRLVDRMSTDDEVDRAMAELWVQMARGLRQMAAACRDDFADGVEDEVRRGHAWGMVQAATEILRMHAERFGASS